MRNDSGAFDEQQYKEERRDSMREEKKITMRTPFQAHQISKLPKPTKAQTDEVRADYTKGIRCNVCGGWHHPKVVHLDYVGHAALTDRLLDVDPNWTWKPVAFDSLGLPAIDDGGGLWIELTVLGVTRLGYGDAQGKTGGDAMKERIGDALRNAAMRFGAALDLWHKGELHIDDNAKVVAEEKTERPTITLETLAEKYAIDTINDDGEVTKFSAKSKIQQGEGTAQKLIDFLAAKYIMPKEVLVEIKSWEKK